MIDPIAAADTSIRDAEDDIQRSGIGHLQTSNAISAIDGGVNQMSGGDSLYQSIGQLLLRLDALTKVIDVVSEVSMDHAMYCATLIEPTDTPISQHSVEFDLGPIEGTEWLIIRIKLQLIRC